MMDKPFGLKAMADDIRQVKEDIEDETITFHGRAGIFNHPGFSLKLNNPRNIVKLDSGIGKTTMITVKTTVGELENILMRAINTLEPHNCPKDFYDLHTTMSNHADKKEQITLRIETALEWPEFHTEFSQL